MAAKRYSFEFYVAILVAIGTTYSVFKVLESTKASSRVATAPVVVASRDLGEGELIDRIALSVAQWPVSTVPVGAYGRLDSVAGRVARVAVFNGEPLVPGRLAPEGTTPGLTSKITPGKRATGIRMNDVSGLAGLIQPNSRVDTVLTTTPSNSPKKGQIFMQNMRVLAMQTQTDKTADGRPIPATVAMLEVTPEELELLSVAQTQGSITLALRGYGDPDSTKTQGATSADLERALRNAPPVSEQPRRQTAARNNPPAPVKPETVRVNVPAPVAKAPAKPDSAKVEVFRGANKSELKFQKDSVKRDTIVKN